MLTGIFAIVQLILKLFGAWEQFLDYADKQRIADAEKRNQDRNKAVDEQKKAQTEEEFDRAQDKIVGANPPP